MYAISRLYAKLSCLGLFLWAFLNRGNSSKEKKWTNLVHAFHFWRLVRIVLPDLEREAEFPSSVKSFVRLDDQLEVEEVVRIRKFRSAGLWQLQLVDVFRDPELKGFDKTTKWTLIKLLRYNFIGWLDAWSRVFCSICAYWASFASSRKAKNIFVSSVAPPWGTWIKDAELIG